MSDLVLYNYFRSSTSYRARLALHWKGLAFDYKPIHLLKNEQRSPAFLALNPQGEVPTLIHKGQVISQSLAILEYLDEVFPQIRIYPTDPVQRAQVREFCEHINAFIHPLGNLKVQKYLETQHGFDQAAKDKWVLHWLNEGFTALEKILEKSAGTYCFGEQPTAADFCLIPAVFTARRFHLDMTPFPIINRIDQHCKTVEKMMKAHPLNQIDTPEELRQGT